METQWVVLERVLGFDRSFQPRDSRETVVVVLYQQGYRESLQAYQAFRDMAVALRGGSAERPQVRLVPIDVSAGDIGGRIGTARPDVVYVAPLRAFDVRDIAKSASTMSVPTVTGVRQYVTSGLAVGVGLRGGRPEVLVNLVAARAQGMDLNSQFLRLATVIGSATEPGQGRPPSTPLARAPTALSVTRSMTSGALR